MDAKIGMIVRSAAGHDKNSFMVITAVVDDFAFISDGKHKKLENPKKKRLKHLKLTNTVVDPFNLTDKQLRKLLREYTEKALSSENLNQNV